MIAGLKGKIFQKKLNTVLIDINNIIYEINVSVNSYSELKDEVFLYITEIIREDSYTLYGFINDFEKKMFDTLIKINGVGPKVAIAICSTFTPENFLEIIKTKNVSALKKVPGIGPKSASRILIELEEFTITGIGSAEKNSFILDAITALENLGFKKDTIIKALKDVKVTSTEEAIKLGLKKLASF